MAAAVAVVVEAAVAVAVAVAVLRLCGAEDSFCERMDLTSCM